MIMDEQSPNPLAADSDSGEEFTRHVDSDFLDDTDADSDFLPEESDEIESGDELEQNQSWCENKHNHLIVHAIIFKMVYEWIRLDEWLRRYSSLK